MIINLFNSDELFILSRLISKNYNFSLAGVVKSIDATVDSCSDPIIKDIYVGLKSKLCGISQLKWLGLVPLIIPFALYDQDDYMIFEI
jgi:hypothetical protein